LRFEIHAAARLGDYFNFLASSGTGVVESMTIAEIAAQLRVALGNCVNSDKDVSPAERSYLTAAPQDAAILCDC
jgi:hypothetical protein